MEPAALGSGAALRVWRQSTVACDFTLGPDPSNHCAPDFTLGPDPRGSDFTLGPDPRVENETVWLTQAQMAELFQTTRNNTTLHIGNIFKEGELEDSAVRKESLLTAADG